MTGAKNTVVIPETAIVRLLIAPSISPNSIAFAVPIAWEDAPMAIPNAILSSILKNLYKIGLKIEPMIPVRIIAATVTDWIPSSCCETAIPIGVVMDFGISDLISTSDIPKNF